ncbi:MAG: arylsulfatase A-like enzyme [Verrucomicrobiales bacterium]|jgi:arylsulfatase A-like enzyme
MNLLSRLLPVAIFLTALSAAAERPNIVFIYIDDMGYADPGCFGNPKMKTPNIDRLADEGLRLTNYYSNSPICSPSRVAVTTGQYPARWGIHSYLNSHSRNKDRGMKSWLDAAAPTTAKKLQAAGYATAHFGKWHMGGGRDVEEAPLPTDYGFDESLVSFEGLGDRLLLEGGGLNGQSRALGRGEIIDVERWQRVGIYVDRAIDFVRRNREKPFYLQVFPNDVHDPFVPPPGSAEKWAEVAGNPSEQNFFAVLEEMDKKIGRLIAEIDSSGLAERTLIVFTSDNGPTDWPSYYNRGEDPPGFTGEFYGRKWSLYEGGIRMPFIARWPGKIPAGAVDEESIVSGIDLPPTFCKFASVGVEDDLDGFDSGGVLLGKPQRRPEPLFWQYGPPYAQLMPGNPDFQSPSLAVRDGNWKLLANADGSEARLFNLAEDPGETTNLLNREPERAAVLWRKIQGWSKDVGQDASGDLKPPVPALTANIGRGASRIRNHGVELEDEAWRFDGEAWLEAFQAPNIAGKPIGIQATIQSEATDGVIVAQGGDRAGYSLYLKDGRLAFSACVDWKRTTIVSELLLGGEPREVEAIWKKGGAMVLKIGGKIVVKGKAASLISNQPGDSLQIGADLIQPAGEYETPNRFRGVVSDFRLKIPF